MCKVREYREKRCNSKGHIRSCNISYTNKNGLKELTKKVKEKEIDVFTTDKSGKLTADSVSNYLDALDKHSGDDIVIDDDRVKVTEKT